MTIDDVRRKGFSEGYEIAQENSDALEGRDEDDFVGYIFGIHEEHFRQFSPFEFFAKELNESENSEELWDAYDEAIMDGARKFYQEVKDDYDSN